jgi:hypothetical protein
LEFLKKSSFLEKIRGDDDITVRSPQMGEQGKSRANQPGVLVLGAPPVSDIVYRR